MISATARLVNENEVPLYIPNLRQYSKLSFLHLVLLLGGLCDTTTITRYYQPVAGSSPASGVKSSPEDISQNPQLSESILMYQ